MWFLRSGPSAGVSPWKGGAATGLGKTYAVRKNQEQRPREEIVVGGAFLSECAEVMALEHVQEFEQQRADRRWRVCADREPAVAAAHGLTDFGSARGEITRGDRRSVALEVRCHGAARLSRVEVVGTLDRDSPQGAREIGLHQPLTDVRHSALPREDVRARRRGRKHPISVEGRRGLQHRVVRSPILMQVRVDRESLFRVPDRGLEQALPRNAAAAELVECNLRPPDEGGDQHRLVSKKELARRPVGKHFLARLRAGLVEKIDDDIAPARRVIDIHHARSRDRRHRRRDDCLRIRRGQRGVDRRTSGAEDLRASRGGQRLWADDDPIRHGVWIEPDQTWR